MPWHGLGGQFTRPVNAATEAAYRGVNVVALWAEAALRGYSTSQWASYRQWQQIGAQVRQGERGTVIVFFKEVEREDFGEPNGGVDTPRLIARASRVFNAGQVDGWQTTEQEAPAVSQVEALTGVDAFIRSTKADMRTRPPSSSSYKTSTRVGQRTKIFKSSPSQVGLVCEKLA